MLCSVEVAGLESSMGYQQYLKVKHIYQKQKTGKQLNI